MTNRKVFVEPQLHAEATVANGTLTYMVSGSQGTSMSSVSSITSDD